MKRVVPIGSELVAEILAELTSDLPPMAVRLGMLGSAGVAAAVADFLERTAPPNIVVDPIILSSSGAWLVDEAGLRILTERILPLASIVTPNVDEAAALAGISVTDDASRREAGERMLGLGAKAAVVTGGHLKLATDLLVYRDEHGEIVEQLIGSGEKLSSTSTHGTGCAFATSLACGLALGRTIPGAVLAAKHYVTEAIRHARSMGRGTGPLEHLWKGRQ